MLFRSKTIANIVGALLGIWLISMGVLIVIVLLARRRKRPTTRKPRSMRTKPRATPDA